MFEHMTNLCVLLNYNITPCLPRIEVLSLRESVLNGKRTKTANEADSMALLKRGRKITSEVTLSEKTLVFRERLVFMDWTSDCFFGLDIGDRWVVSLDWTLDCFTGLDIGLFRWIVSMDQWTLDCFIAGLDIGLLMTSNVS